MSKTLLSLNERILPLKESVVTILFLLDTSRKDLHDLLGDVFNFETCLRILSLKEQVRIRNVKNEKERIKKLLSTLFQRKILNYLLHIYGTNDSFDPWKKVDYIFNNFGKPAIAASSNFEYNTSSSNDIFCMAVNLNSNLPIGVDISHSEQDISETSILEDFHPMFHQTEIECLSKIKDSHNRYIIFNQLWTLKEAFIKCVGTGLNVNLSDFYFHFDGGMINVQDAPKDIFQNPTVELKWESGISLKFTREVGTELKGFSTNIYFCRSSVIQGGVRLPIIASIISQSDNDIYSFTDDMDDLKLHLL